MAETRQPNAPEGATPPTKTDRPVNIGARSENVMAQAPWGVQFKRLSWHRVTMLPRGSHSSRTWLGRSDDGQQAILREVPPDTSPFTCPEMPGLVPLREVTMVGSRRMTVWDWVDGESLQELIERVREGRDEVPLGLILRVALDAAQALMSVSPARPHGGLSDATLLIASASGQTWVMDFGCPRPSRFAALGAASLQNDVFSLAGIIHSAVTGYGGTYASAVTAGLPLPKPSQADPNCPSGLDAVVLRALARTSDERQADLRVLANDLERVAGSLLFTPKQVVDFIHTHTQSPGQAPEIGDEPTRQHVGPLVEEGAEPLTLAGVPEQSLAADPAATKPSRPSAHLPSPPNPRVSPKPAPRSSAPRTPRASGPKSLASVSFSTDPRSEARLEWAQAQKRVPTPPIGIPAADDPSTDSEFTPLPKGDVAFQPTVRRLNQVNADDTGPVPEVGPFSHVSERNEFAERTGTDVRTLPGSGRRKVIASLLVFIAGLLGYGLSKKLKEPKRVIAVVAVLDAGNFPTLKEADVEAEADAASFEDDGGTDETEVEEDGGIADESIPDGSTADSGVKKLVKKKVKRRHRR